MGRRDPADDRGLEPQAPAARLAAGRRRGDATASSSASVTSSRASAAARCCATSGRSLRSSASSAASTSAAERRGVFALGPVELAVGDLVARRAASRRAAGDADVPRPSSDGRHAGARATGAVGRRRPGPRRPDRGSGAIRGRPAVRARRSPPTDPPASERPARAPGHEAVRAVARPRGPHRARRPDRRTGRPGRSAFDDDAVEGLYVVAASIARSLAAERAAFGFTAAGYTGPRRGSPTSRSRRRPARSSGSSTCSPGCRRTRRRRSSGCSSSSTGSSAPERRSSS